MLPDPLPLQSGTVLARSRPSHAGWRGGRKRPALTRPARGARLRDRSGRRNSAPIEQRNRISRHKTTDGQSPPGNVTSRLPIGGGGCPHIGSVSPL